MRPTPAAPPRSPFEACPDWSFLRQEHPRAESRPEAAIFEASEDLHAEILDRIEAGPWVIGEEHLRGVEAEGMPEAVHLAVAHEVEEGKITFVRLFM